MKPLYPASHLRRGLFAAVTAILVCIQAGEAAVDTVTTPLKEIVSGSLDCAVLSADGTQFITGSEDSRVRLWNVAAGKVLRTFVGHTSSITLLGISPDGSKILSASADNSIRMWDAQTGRQLWVATGKSLPTSLAFSADGKLFLTAFQWDSTCVWRTDSLYLVNRFYGEKGAFFPDGKTILTATNDTIIRFRDIPAGNPTRTFPSVGRFKALSSDGKKILTELVDSLCIWDAASGALLAHIDNNYADKVKAISPDFQKVAVGSSPSIRNYIQIYNASTGALSRTLKADTLFGQIGYLSLAFFPDGVRLLSAASDNTVRVWNTTDGTFSHLFAGHVFLPGPLVFSPDGMKLCTGSGDNTLSIQRENHYRALLWEIASGDCLRGFAVSDNGYRGVNAIAFSGDGSKIMTSCPPGIPVLWDAATGSPLKTFAADYNLKTVSCSIDGSKVLAGPVWNAGVYCINLLNVSGGGVIRTFAADSAITPGYAAFSPDGSRTVTISDYIRVWNTVTGDSVATIRIGLLDKCIAFSPDGKKILAGGLSDSTVRLFDATTGAAIRTFSGHPNVVHSVAFSPDGSKILAGSSYTVPVDNGPYKTYYYPGLTYLWSAAGVILKIFKQKEITRALCEPVSAVAFTPDGSRILTGCSSRYAFSARLWDANSFPVSAPARPDLRREPMRISFSGPGAITIFLPPEATITDESKFILYRLNGRCIARESLHAPRASAGRVRIPLRQPLAEGVYLYHFTATGKRCSDWSGSVTITR
jgi:WD40 repeat protein